MMKSFEESFESQFSENDPRKSKSKFMLKHEEYKLLNEQIEQKSSDLFERIEKFSKSRNPNIEDVKKCQSLCGGGDSFLLSDGESDHDRFSTKSMGHDRYQSSDDLEGEYDPPNDEVAQLTKKLAFLSAPSTKKSTNTSRTENRKPGRLQRATESVIEQLQSKLVNHEERLADLHLQYRQKIQENTVLEGRVKALEEEREKLFKTTNSLQTTVEKHAKVAIDSKSNLSVKEATVALMKKQIEELKREQRMQNANTQSFQSRFHRAMEENDRLKNQNKSLGQQMREIGGESRHRMDEQSHRIQELERQKASLHSSLNKQAQLVEKLKKRTRGTNRDPDDSQSCFSP